MLEDEVVVDAPVGAGRETEQSVPRLVRPLLDAGAWIVLVHPGQPRGSIESLVVATWPLVLSRTPMPISCGSASSSRRMFASPLAAVVSCASVSRSRSSIACAGRVLPLASLITTVSDRLAT